MDIATLLFVGILILVAFFLTATVRREFLAQERQRRAQESQTRRPRRKP
jgi:hypothetical protein